jgi:type IV pilus assembly protein PilW
MAQVSIPKQMRSGGFSLVEVMVAMAISTILLAGVLTVVYSSKVTYLENERVGRLQENGRAAMEIVLRDLRGAGFPGCAQPIPGLFQINNVIASNTTVLWNLAQPVFGYDAKSDGSWAPALDTALTPGAIVGSDVVIVRGVRAGAPVFRLPNSLNPTDDIVVDKAAGESLAVPTPMVISDCAGASIFVATGFTPDADDVTASIARGTGGTAPTNTTDDLGAAFNRGARVAPIVTIVYYIAPSGLGAGPALWRVVGGSGPQEVIQGVEELQVRYGVDTNADALIDQYQEADEVTNWSNVISVSIAMLIRSNDANSPAADGRTFTLFDATPDGRLPAVTAGPFADRFQRSLFTTTVTLRNRTT